MPNLLRVRKKNNNCNALEGEPHKFSIQFVFVFFVSAVSVTEIAEMRVKKKRKRKENDKKELARMTRIKEMRGYSVVPVQEIEL